MRPPGSCSPGRSVPPPVGVLLCYFGIDLLDIGKVFVSRLGKKGSRVVICLGPKVTSAENLQLASSGQEIRISQTIYDALDEGILKEQFHKDTDAYVANCLTFPRLDELEEEEAARKGKLG
ncbi:MAG: hypothetical protein AAB268_07315, partial [Elusimicrobiota bacterium]